MIIGLLFLGSCVGIMAACVSLVLGHSVLTALLVYACAGALGTVLPIAICLFRPRKSKTLQQGTVTPSTHS